MIPGSPCPEQGLDLPLAGWITCAACESCAGFSHISTEPVLLILTKREAWERPHERCCPALGQEGRYVFAVQDKTLESTGGCASVLQCAGSGRACAMRLHDQSCRVRAKRFQGRAQLQETPCPGDAGMD